jgi:hypothetical protein
MIFGITGMLVQDIPEFSACEEDLVDVSSGQCCLPARVDTGGLKAATNLQRKSEDLQIGFFHRERSEVVTLVTIYTRCRGLLNFVHFVVRWKNFTVAYCDARNTGESMFIIPLILTFHKMITYF